MYTNSLLHAHEKSWEHIPWVRIIESESLRITESKSLKKELHRKGNERQILRHVRQILRYSGKGTKKIKTLAREVRAGWKAEVSQQACTTRPKKHDGSCVMSCT